MGSPQAEQRLEGGVWVVRRIGTETYAWAAGSRPDLIRPRLATMATVAITRRWHRRRRAAGTPWPAGDSCWDRSTRFISSSFSARSCRTPVGQVVRRLGQLVGSADVSPAGGYLLIGEEFDRHHRSRDDVPARGTAVAYVSVPILLTAPYGPGSWEMPVPAYLTRRLRDALPPEIDARPVWYSEINPTLGGTPGQVPSRPGLIPGGHLLLKA